MYIKLEIHIWPPPPSGLIFFPQKKFNIMTRCAPQAKNFQPFFVQFCKFLVNWGKNKHFFANWGKNMHFPPFFHSLLIIFFPNLLIGHIFATNRKIYTPAFLWLTTTMIQEGLQLEPEAMGLYQLIITGSPIGNTTP